MLKKIQVLYFNTWFDKKKQLTKADGIAIPLSISHTYLSNEQGGPRVKPTPVKHFLKRFLKMESSLYTDMNI